MTSTEHLYLTLEEILANDPDLLAMVDEQIEADEKAAADVKT